MAADFNPYHVWLGIPPEEQPANYYRLLSLKQFETNGDVIDSAADRQMAHLRTFQSGKHGELTQRILNEVAAARVCLLDPKKRAAYDQQLRANLVAATAAAPAAGAVSQLAGGSAILRQPPRRPADVMAAAPAASFPAPTTVPKPVDQWEDLLGNPTDKQAFRPAGKPAGATTAQVNAARQRGSNSRMIAIGIGAAAVLIAAVGIGVFALNSPSDGTLLFDWPLADRPDTTITVDGVPLLPPTSGPWEYRGPAGPHHIVAEHLAYKLDANVAIVAGQQQSVPSDWKPKATLALDWPVALHSGAELKVDGRTQLITQHDPLELAVEPGPHVVQVTLHGSSPITLTTTIAPDGRQLISIRPPPPTSTKLVFDWPSDQRKGAELIIDGSRQSVPVGGGSTSFALVVAPGRRVVHITRTGFEPFDQTVDLAAGENQSLTPIWTPEKKVAPTVVVDTPARAETKTLPVEPVKKLPVPAAAEQDRIAKQLDDLYKVSGPGPKQPQQAQELYDVAAKAGVPAAERYMLLTKGAEIAAVAGDLNLSLQGIDTLDGEYEIDSLEAKQKLLDKFVNAGKPDQLADAIPTLEQLMIDQAIAADRYEVALQLANTASRAVAKSKIATRKEIDERLSRRRHDIHMLEPIYAAAKKAQETLDKTPADPDANLNVGRWHAFYKADWAGGLPLLAKGSDEKLKVLAEQELKAPADADGQAQLADAWWDMAQKEAGIARDSLRLHAGDIYKAVLPNLASALKKAAIKRRMAEIADLKPIVARAAASNPTGASKFPLGQWVDLLPLVDLSRDSLRGQWSRSGTEILSDSTNLAMFEIPVAIEGAYDLEVDFTRADGNDSIDTIIPVGTHQCSLKLSGWAGKASGLALVDGRQPVDAGYSAPAWPGSLENGRRYHLLIRVRLLEAGRASIDVLLNGKPFLPSWTGDQSSLMQGFKLSSPKYLGFAANWSHTTYRAVRLKLVSGNASAVASVNESAAPTNSDSSPPSGKTRVAVGRWIDLLRQVDPVRDAVSGKWTRDAANVSCSPGSSVQLKLPAAPSVSYDFEVEFTRTASDGDVMTFFTVGQRMVMLVLCAHHGAVSGLQEIDGLLAEAAGNPTSKRSGERGEAANAAALETGHRYRLLMRVRILSGGRGSVDVSLDGQPYLPHWVGSLDSLALPSSWAQSTPHQLALGAFENNTTFHAARFRTVKIQPANTTSPTPAAGASSKSDDTDGGVKLAFTKWTYVADENGRSGDFEKNATEWIEMKDGKVWAHFKESARNAKYVELFDATRHIWVRLTPTEASWSRDRANWITSGKGAPATEP
jgi:hypothetical protein